MDDVTIPAAVAAYMFEVDDGYRGDGWQRIADHEADSGRWLEHHWLIVKRDGEDGLFGIPYALGLTEMQDHEFPWKADPWTGKEPDPIKLVPLVAEVVSRTVYRRAES
jgi:hypothetical protein